MFLECSSRRRIDKLDDIFILLNHCCLCYAVSFVVDFVVLLRKMEMKNDDEDLCCVVVCVSKREKSII